MPLPTLGTLPWRPALDHLDLLAPVTAEAVRSAGPAWAADCHVAPIADDLADTAAFCAAYEVPLDASANCVVVSGRRAETTTLAACLVLATDRADVNKAVRHQLGVRKISFAPMAEATERSSMAYGGITPVGLPSEWPVLVDEAVVDQPWVVVGSGTRGSKLLLPGARLAELSNAHVMLLRQVG